MHSPSVILSEAKGLFGSRDCVPCDAMPGSSLPCLEADFWGQRFKIEREPQACKEAALEGRVGLLITKSLYEPSFPGLVHLQRKSRNLFIRLAS